MRNLETLFVKISKFLVAYYSTVISISRFLSKKNQMRFCQFVEKQKAKEFREI